MLLAPSPLDLFCFAEQKSQGVSRISGWLGADAEVFGSSHRARVVDGRTWCVYVLFQFYASFFFFIILKGEAVWAAPAKAVTLEALGMDGDRCVTTGMGFACKVCGC